MKSFLVNAITARQRKQQQEKYILNEDVFENVPLITLAVMDVRVVHV